MYKTHRHSNSLCPVSCILPTLPAVGYNEESYRYVGTDTAKHVTRGQHVARGDTRLLLTRSLAKQREDRSNLEIL
jgi:hypothetical protein